MTKLIAAMHVTLDGYVAGPKREMDWICLSEDLFDFVGSLTEKASAPLYGRKTFEMMDHYWPAAGSKPNATKHDKEHSAWYNSVTKYVLSNSRSEELPKVTFIRGASLASSIQTIKGKERGNILIFGSFSAVHSLLAENLIDEIYLFTNPVLLSQIGVICSH